MRASIFALALSLSLLATLAPPAQAGDDGTVRVLLIGNSYTRYHHLHMMLRRLSNHDPGGPRLIARRETRPGCTLRRHWLGREATARIRSGRYTHVVLQGHSLRPLDRPEELARYVERFDALIDSVGAETVLYATWAREEGSGFYREREALEGPTAMQERIDDVYGSLAHDLDAEIAPVGAAWLEVSRRHPELDLHGGDGAHPSVLGTYLTATVLYGTLTDRDPLDADWAPYPMDPETAQELRRVASRVLRH